MAGDEAAHALHEGLLGAGRERAARARPRAAPRAAAARARAARRRRRGCRWRPGTTERVAMSPTASVDAERHQAAQRGAARAGRAARRAPASAGPATTSCISGGEVSWRSYQRGTCRRPSASGPGGRSARRARRRGGRRRRPSRAPSGSPASATTLDVSRRGSRRRKRCGPPETSSAIPAAAREPGDRGERPRAPRQARGRPGGAQQRDRDRERAGGPLLLDPGLEPELREPVADPLGGRALPVRGGRPVDRLEVLDGLAQAAGIGRHRGLAG